MTGATKPLLFLDVDGVLNALGKPQREGGLYTLLDAYNAQHCRTFRLAVLPSWREWLRELQQTYQLVWATTWNHSAPLSVAPLLGLPEMEVVEVNERGSLDQWDPEDGLVPFHKAEAILRYLESTGQTDLPWAFVDDDLVNYPDTGEWVRRSGYTSWALLPCPPDTGMTRSLVDSLLALGGSELTSGADRGDQQLPPGRATTVPSS